MFRLNRPVLLTLTLVLACAVRARAGEHPVPLEKNIDAAKCLECHEDKTKGPHIHSAIAMGCTACHEVKVVDKDTTNVELIAPKEELCFTCHEKSSASTLHRPYEQGRCVICHDPHVSDFDKQLRADGNKLCLECHQNRKITGTLALFKTSHELKEDEFQQIPKISLDPTLRFGHPMGSHRVADAPNPLKPGEKISCLTCHDNHAAEREKLVRMTEYKGKKMDVCDACHLTNDEAAMAIAQKRADEMEAQREEERKTLSKQPMVMPQRPPKPGTKKP
jgi:predicted CXXCH cytochrome family protein